MTHIPDQFECEHFVICVILMSKIIKNTSTKVVHMIDNLQKYRIQANPQTIKQKSVRLVVIEQFQQISCGVFCWPDDLIPIVLQSTQVPLCFCSPIFGRCNNLKESVELGPGRFVNGRNIPVPLAGCPWRSVPSDCSRCRPISLSFCGRIILLVVFEPLQLGEQRMGECLFPRHPIFLLDFQRSSNPFFASFRNRTIEHYLSVHDVVDQLDLVVGWPRSVAVQQLVIDKPNRPKVRFVGVVRPVQDLWGHVQRGPNNRIHHGVLPILQILREAEVADLAATIFQKNIGWLEVPMGDSQRMQISESIGDILKQSNSLFFGNLLPAFNKVHKIALLAEFSDDVHIIGSLVDVEKPHNIFMFDLFHDLDFGLDVLQVIVVRENLLIDDLHGYRLVICNTPAQVHLSVCALPYRPLELDYVLLDLLLSVVQLLLLQHCRQRFEYQNIIPIESPRPFNSSQYIYLHIHKTKKLLRCSEYCFPQVCQVSYIFRTLTKQLIEYLLRIRKLAIFRLARQL